MFAKQLPGHTGYKRVTEHFGRQGPCADWVPCSDIVQPCFTMAFPSSVAGLVLLVPLVLAKSNNWDAPCFDGKCAYDVAQSGPHGPTTGSLFIVPTSADLSSIFMLTLRMLGWLCKRNFGYYARSWMDYP